MQNANLDMLQAGNRIARRNINNFTYADDITPNAKKRGETKVPLDESERGE